jgi:DNA polymerase III delta prime subunit
MAKLSRVAKSATHTVLVYGPPKVGKTQLVSELASEFNLIWFDLENGSATLYKLPTEQQERVELISLPDSRSYPIAIETMLKVIKGNPCIIDDETGKVVTKEVEGKTYTRVCLNELGPNTVVAVDSLTQLTNSAIAHITKNQPDDYKLNYDDWGNLGKLMDIFLSHVQQAKYNIVCISHETEAELEDGKIKIVPTAGSRAFSRNTAKYFGHVIYCQVANKKHSFSSSTTSMLNVVVGSRTDVATERMDKPSLIPIFKNSPNIPATPQSNGQKAATQLTALQQKIQAAKEANALKEKSNGQ